MACHLSRRSSAITTTLFSTELTNLTFNLQVSATCCHRQCLSGLLRHFEFYRIVHLISVLLQNMFCRIPAFTNWTIEPLSGQLLQMFFIRMFVELFGAAKSLWAILTCHPFSGTGLFQGRVVEGVLVVLQDVGGRVVTFTDVTLNPILDDVLQVFGVCMFEEVLGVDQGDVAVLTDHSLWRHFISQKRIRGKKKSWSQNLTI